eukprot:TRINITY_DN25208_c0_g1_i1.p2 TRINITY_DN25208_c0_g1~~TRINITY_DN25208_c0_g1_i1.p2  ORF type:complete len:125 (+),score=0.13 TRINITY_DN25208_c0_g1_i1:161-535(+)
MMCFLCQPWGFCCCFNTMSLPLYHSPPSPFLMLVEKRPHILICIYPLLPSPFFACFARSIFFFPSAFKKGLAEPAETPFLKLCAFLFFAALFAKNTSSNRSVFLKFVVSLLLTFCKKVVERCCK